MRKLKCFSIAFLRQFAIILCNNMFQFLTFANALDILVEYSLVYKPRKYYSHLIPIHLN